MLQPPGSVIEVAHVVGDLDAAIGSSSTLFDYAGKDSGSS